MQAGYEKKTLHCFIIYTNLEVFSAACQKTKWNSKTYTRIKERKEGRTKARKESRERKKKASKLLMPLFVALGAG